jgi:iron-sulfur cluster repair protein YtfE (RIC family)
MSSHSHALPVNEAAAVRQEILTQHMELRRLLDCTNRLVRASAPQSEYVRRLRSGAAVLLRSLERHMAYEEAALVPILRETDSWGSVRADRLIEEHVRQREELRTMADVAAEESDGRSIGLALQALVADVLADMKHEEASLLNAQVLHDVPLSHGPFNG